MCGELRRRCFQRYIRDMPVKKRLTVTEPKKSKRVAKRGSDKHEIVYFYRGPVERGVGRNAHSQNGYSPETSTGNAARPWLTRREALSAAKDRGVRAVFMYALDKHGFPITEPPAAAREIRRGLSADLYRPTTGEERAAVYRPTPKKSPAQIKREVDAVLAGGSSRAHATMKGPFSAQALLKSLAKHFAKRAHTREVINWISGLLLDTKSREDFAQEIRDFIDSGGTTRHPEGEIIRDLALEMADAVDENRV